MNPETRSDLLTWLAANVPETRIRHILRVEQMSIDLARHHGIDPDLAAQAGLMHDLAKYFKSDRLLTMAENAGLILNDIEQQVPHLIHADVSAIVAREEFGITHEGILNAIANHTLGKPGMDPLSCIVYLADTLEPGRGKTDELNELRALSLENLKIAVWRTADYSLQYLLKSQQLIHPRTVLTRNWFLQEVSSHT
jgi:predicted HD superfamily hydrolase involved in NAD metabolism